MSVTEEITMTIAEVEVNDGCRVELRQIRKRTDYTPEQAEQIAAELIVAAGRAREALGDMVRDTSQRMREEGLIGADLLEVMGGVVTQLRREGTDPQPPTGGAA